VDNGGGINFGDAFENSGFEFFPRLDSNMSQEGPGHLAEERLDDVEPRAVFGRQDVLESVGVGCQKGSRLFGEVRGMIVQYDPDLAMRRIPGIEVR
jgi:hypothetical protein